MTESTWLAYAREHKVRLGTLIKYYHPLYRPAEIGDIIITAPGAEAACENVRKQIVKQQEGTEPLARFDTALQNNDWMTINSLLNDAWFGVPESRSCWDIVGFKEAVHLIEEPPE